MRDVDARSGGRHRTVAATIAVVAIGGLLGGPAPQRAYAATALAPEVEAALSDGTLREFTYRTGAAGTTAPTCGTTCNYLIDQQRAPMPSQAGARGLIDDTVRVGDKVGVLKRINALVGRFSPHGAALGAGLLIGTGINRKWLRINFPGTEIAVGPQWAPPPTHIYRADYYAKDLIVSDGFLAAPSMPFDGYLLRNVSINSDGQFDSHGAGVGNCMRTPSTVSAAWTIFQYQWSTACQPGVPLFKSLYLLPEKSLIDGPIEDYDAQPRPPASNTNYPDIPDPGPDVVQQRLREALESGNHPVLNDWLCAQLGGDCVDPTGQLIRPPACRGDSYTTCRVRLQDAGFSGTITQQTLSADDAIMEEQANRVTATAPAMGSQTEHDADIIVYVNPDPMPQMTATETLVATQLEQKHPDVDVDPTSGKSRVAWKTIARNCTRAVGAAQINGLQPTDCATLPIFVTGADGADAAENDLAAIADRPKWVLLHNWDSTPKNTSWYRNRKFENGPGCLDAENPLYIDPQGTNCDEYPFWPTIQGFGGPLGYSGGVGPRPRIMWTRGSQNQHQGRALGYWIRGGPPLQFGSLFPRCDIPKEA